LGLVAPAKQVIIPCPPVFPEGARLPFVPGKWPDYDRCLQGAPHNHSNSGPDTSRADFTWCMTALDWGFAIPETTAKLMEVSAKAKENGPRYAALTAQNAAKAVENKGLKAGRA
jgi:hypothetical protein